MAREAAPPRRTSGARGDISCPEHLLAVLQLSDSAFPSGRYTLSHGLETFVQTGHLTVPVDIPALSALLSDSVRFGVAPSDGVALACAHRALGSDGHLDLDLVTEIDERLTAIKLPREVRAASLRTGRAVLATVSASMSGAALREYAARVGQGSSPGNHAVVVGVLSAEAGVPRLEAVVGELYAFSSGWVAAAVRLGVVDHRSAQTLLYRSRPVIADAAAEALERDLTQISSCTPLLDVMSMRHEHSELRLFAS